MTIFCVLTFFVFGIIIGSFLNVVIYRYGTERDLGGRSACMTCQNKLAWYELVPVVSFLALRGRCRTCKTKISRQYPLVELASGVIFASLFWKFQDIFFVDIHSFIILYTYYVVLFSLLLVIATYDIKHKIIPDKLALVFGVLAFGGIFFFGVYKSTAVVFLHMPHLLDLFAGLILALPFALVWLFSKGAWMGLGDAKLMIGLGYLLGFYPGLSAIVLSFWAGALIGIILIGLSKKGMKSEIPFAPFLVLGTFLTFVLGLQIFFIGF